MSVAVRVIEVQLRVLRAIVPPFRHRGAPDEKAQISVIGMGWCVNVIFEVRLGERDS